MTTHNYATPAPWVADACGRTGVITVSGYQDVPIAVISKQDPQMDGGRCFDAERANARLIAAAPTLLVALRELADASVDFRLHSTAHSRLVAADIQARAAIAQAEGRA